MERELLIRKRTTALDFLSVYLKTIKENAKHGERLTHWENQLIDAFERYCGVPKPNYRSILLDEIEYQITAIRGRIDSNCASSTEGECNLFLMIYNLL